MRLPKNQTKIIIYYILRILPEFLLLGYLMWEGGFILPALSLGIIGYNAYSQFISKTEKLVIFTRIFNLIYSLIVFLIGCLWLAGGNFRAHHAPVFFAIGVFFGVLEILKYFFIEIREFAPKMKTRKLFISLGLMGMLFTSLYLVTFFTSRTPPLYTQEDLDAATIASVDVGINSSLAPYGIDFFKIWHAGEDFLTSDFHILSQDCALECSSIYDKNLMAVGGSVSVGDGRTTIIMTDDEGWVYFYVKWMQIDGVYFTDLENRTEPADYSFMITSNHLNFYHPP